MWCVGISNRLPNVDSLDPGNCENVSRPADRLVNALEALERIQLRDFSFLKSSVELHDPHFVSEIQCAVENTRNRQPPEIVAVIQVRDKNLQWACRIAGWV